MFDTTMPSTTFSDRYTTLRSQLGQACGLLEIALARAIEPHPTAAGDAAGAVRCNVEQAIQLCRSIKKTSIALAWRASHRSDLPGLWRSFLDAHDLAAMAASITAIAERHATGTAWAINPLAPQLCTLTADLHHLLLDTDPARADRILAAIGAWDDATSATQVQHHQHVYDCAASIAHRYRTK